MDGVLSDGWQMRVTEAGACPDPAVAGAENGWIAATVPGTALATLGTASPELYGKDVWWRCDIDGHGRFRLEFDGVATLAEVWLGDRLVSTSRSMFVPFACEIDLDGPAQLHVCCRALTDSFERKLPRARWRTKLVATPGLRGVRTTLLGQVASLMPKSDVVGPWRAVRLVDLSSVAVSDVSIHATLDAANRGMLQVCLRAANASSVKLHCGGAEVELTRNSEGVYSSVLTIDAVEPWWPHTHGAPRLYDVTFEVDGQSISYGQTGFRRVEVDWGGDGLGFGLVVNGEPVFARGACWISADAIGLKHDEATYRPVLDAAKAAGTNLIRMSGVGAYEGSRFYELCDELGIMVWQDFMFANFDYPIDDPQFAEDVKAEADAFLSRTQISPSLVVFCGGSEMLQQATMMGLSPDRCRSALIDDILPEAVNRWRSDCPYVENSPFGHPLPFHTDNGIAHYFGVGAYMRPAQDARRANVRFTTECLAFSNLPLLETHRSLLVGAMPDAEDWRQYVPKDSGADWDFEDVRDHYLRDFAGVDPQALKTSDPFLYHDLSCETVNDLVTRTYWEWRRKGSSCKGAIVWLLQDLMPGAGWGILDVSGCPKAIYYALKRVWQPLHLGLTDEGLNGLGIHIVNEGPDERILDLDLSCWRADGTAVLTRSQRLTVVGRNTLTLSAVELIGAFFDLTYAYRFGPRAHDGVTVTLRDSESGGVIATAHYYLPDASYLPPSYIDVHLGGDSVVGYHLDISTTLPVRGCFIDVPGWRPSDDGFDLSPGASIRVGLIAENGQSAPPGGSVRSRGVGLASFGRASGV